MTTWEQITKIIGNAERIEAQASPEPEAVAALAGMVAELAYIVRDKCVREDE